MEDLQVEVLPVLARDIRKRLGTHQANYVPFHSKTYPEDPNGPDVLCDHPMLWPDTRVVPFHYKHPVTGEQVADDDLRAPHFGKDPSTSTPPLVLSKPKSEMNGTT